MSTPILLIVFPMFGSLIALLGKLLPARMSRAMRPLSILPFAASAWLLVRALPLILVEPINIVVGGYPPGIGIALILDGVAWISATLIVVMTTLIAIASLPYEKFDVRYFFFLHMLAAGMQCVVLTDDVFTMFVSFEIVALGVYVLIAWEKSSQGLLAGLKYLFLSSVGILFFLFGVFLIYRDLGTLSLSVIGTRVAEIGALGQPVNAFLPGPGRSIPLALAALCVGIGVRTAFIPFHTWLPEAHSWAPHPISALLSGVLIKVSFLAMIRIIDLFGTAIPHSLLLWIGAITAVVAVIWALVQHDAKRLLAFHSISQMGYILAAWGAAGTLGETAAYAHAIAHALFKCLLFIAAGIAIDRIKSRDLYQMAGATKRAPVLAVALVVGAAAISGIPPFNGYVSKQLVSAALYDSNAYSLLWIAGVGTIASFTKFSLILRRDTANTVTASEGPPYSPGHLPIVEGFVLAVLILLVLATGVFGRRIVGAMERLRSVSVVGAMHVAEGSNTAVEPVEVPPMFTITNIRALIPQLLAGFALAWAVMRPGIRKLAHRASAIAPQLGTVLAFFVIGLVVFAAAPFF